MPFGFWPSHWHDREHVETACPLGVLLIVGLLAARSHLVRSGHLIDHPHVPAGFTQVRVGQYYAANRPGSG